EHGTRDHHPDQPGMASDEDEVHLDGIGVGDDEDDEDHQDRQSHHDLGDTCLARALKLPHLVLLGPGALRSTGGAPRLLRWLRCTGWARTGLPRPLIRTLPIHRGKPIGFAAVAKRLWPPILAGAGALGILASTARENGRALDRRVYRVINTERGPLADAAFKGVTELGSIWASVGATAALASMSRRREAIDALGAATAMWGLGQVLKRAVLRPRPYRSLDAFRLLIEEPRGTTWPSSHPAVLLAFATVVACNRETPRPVRAGLGALSGAVP